jgi:ATP-dependent Lhr-like helicase
MNGLDSFHPAVRCWFERRFPEGPTPPQEAGWSAIARGRDTLIAAPTGTGKTLAGFLVCIDRLLREGERFCLRPDGPAPAQTQVVYISPLKALAADIQQNLQTPLFEIREVAREMGIDLPELKVSLRTGDTPASERAAMLRRPPHLLVTTPESLYLMITAERSRAILCGVRTVIVDEIHAVARDKRGSHLALSLERLDALSRERPVRVGLSATQRPIETIARFLVGAGEGRSEPDGSPRCEIVDVGHRRELDLSLELPEGEMEAVASAEQLDDVLERIAAHVEKHRTTLVFVNTRRMAERLAHQLGEKLEEKLGARAVASHHGSLSRDRRLRVEAQLRAGELRVLVATASLELGIDIGPVEMVCQVGSPRSFATFIQRVGRSGHCLGATPKGCLYPLTRDELVECSALLRGVRSGCLDAIEPPTAPLDILAQQIVAACAAEDWKEEDLFALFRRASPFAALTRAEFDEIIVLLSEGIVTGRGRRAAYLHRDAVNGVVRGRRGARLAALTSGGAIPETADYRVVASPGDTFVGTVSEDWAIESMRGDIFLLGSTSWRIQRVEAGVVRVEDAGGAPPTIPFWLGEAPARTRELSEAVSELRAGVGEALERGGEAAAVGWLVRECGLGEEAAKQVVTYLAVAKTALGCLPTSRSLVIERFFDEAGGMQLVVHSPLGGRINRGLGLALRKRFCRNFNFELQAAANDDAVVLSLGPHHSFPLADVPRFLNSKSLEDVLSQAVLASPMFTARWRWNLNRSLAVLRHRGGKRNPPPIQRMEADDLMAAVFPGLAACQEHQAGPIEIPDHPLVRQTLHDCLHEAMDIDGLREVVEGIESGRIDVIFADTTEPSPLAHEILTARPYTFLDDAPLEERRTRAVVLRRGLPVAARELGRLDPEAIARVREEAWPQLRSADELHDVLLGVIVLRPEASWEGFFRELVSSGRAGSVEPGAGAMWLAAERRAHVEFLFPEAPIEPGAGPEFSSAFAPPADEEAAARETLRGHLDLRGPLTPEELAEWTQLPLAAIGLGLAQLEAEGFVLRGDFEPDGKREPDLKREGGEQFCARRLLTRIHLYTRERLRREIEPVSARDFLRFLLRWQHATPDTKREGKRGVLAVVEQMQGFEVAAGGWEDAVFPARVENFRPSWLDGLCLSGDVTWGRFAPTERASDAKPRSSASPSRATPLGLALRADVDWWLRVARGDTWPPDPPPGPGLDCLNVLRERGALFQADLIVATGRLPIEVERGLWDLVARGLVHADSFQAVRTLFAARARDARRRLRARSRRGLRRGSRGRDRGGVDGRWSLIPAAPAETFDPDELAEAVAEQLLARWGVVFRDLLARESISLPWRDLLWAFRRMEARGVIRGGRFVAGFVGEQYALPGAVDALRRTRRMPLSGEVVEVSGVDPLNLVGILTPGPRVPSLRTNRVLYRDGEVLPEAGALPVSGR